MRTPYGRIIPLFLLAVKGYILRTLSGIQGVGIHHVDGLPGGEGVDLVEDVGELHLELVAGDVAEVWGADDIVHRKQRMLAAEHRLFLVDIDRRLPRPSRL